MIARHFDPMQRPGQVMEEPTQWSRHRLRLVVVVQACQVAPAWVAAKLDQARAELDPEDQPARRKYREQRGRRLIVAEKDRKKSGLE
jgi:hypothetical protein